MKNCNNSNNSNSNNSNSNNSNNNNNKNSNYDNYLLHKFVSILPLELIEIIRRMTYKRQNKEILEDIIDYYSSKTLIKEIYYKKFINNDNDIANLEDISWLNNDIVSYANCFYPLMFGIFNPHIDLFRKLFYYYNTEDFEKCEKIKNYIYNYNGNKEAILKGINTYWGLFSKKERKNFINIYSKI